MIEETAHPARAWITFKGTVNVTEAHAHLKKKKKKKKADGFKLKGKLASNERLALS